MKKILAVLVFTTCAVLAGCNKSQQINGSTLKTVNRSMTYIKERLPIDQRIEYEVSFWTLRDDIRNNKEFLDAVDGKTPEQLIGMGKELFQKRKAAGVKDYQQYNTWDQMIAQFSQERIEQNRKIVVDERDRKNPQSDTYKLGGM